MFSQNKPLSQNGGNHLHILGLHTTYNLLIRTFSCKACHVGCQYLVKGPPDYYVGEKDLVQGVSVAFGLVRFGLVRFGLGWVGVGVGVAVRVRKEGGKRS